ncbi:MAG: cytochrome c family protein, partial [Hyphomonadaceae bacterium]
GRAAASHAGFTYSGAMQAHGGAWSYDTLNDFLRSPSQVVRGTSMAFAGIRNTDDRVAVIAYLRSIAPNPPPLPAPLPEPEPAAAEGAPAEGAAPAQGAETPPG